MNKKLAIVVGIILTLITGGAVYLMLGSSDQSSQTTPLTNPVTNSQSGGQQGSAAPIGTYTVYQAEKIANTAGTKILFFHAPWCPQCRAIEASIKASNIPEGVTIFKVDYDTNQTLRQKYGVTLQTTFVKVDDQGNLIEKFVAYDEPTFEAVKQNLL